MRGNLAENSGTTTRCVALWIKRDARAFPDSFFFEGRALQFD
jgi:hypothetical protein